MTVSERSPKALAQSRMFAIKNAVDPEIFLPSRIGRLATLIWQHTQAGYLAKHDMAMREWHALSYIAYWQPISGNELAERSGLDRGGVSKAFTILKERGLIESEQDYLDKRRYYVFLTERGAELYHSLLPLVKERETEFASILTPTERKQLDDMLKRLRGQILKMIDEASHD